MSGSRARWRVVVPLVAMTAGVLFGVSSSTSQGGDLRPAVSNMADVVRDASKRVDRQQRTVKGLRGEIQQLTDAHPETARLTALTKQASSLAPAAGLRPMRGKALRVTLTDSTRDVSSLPQGGTTDWLVVHQQDVQGVVNALWRGGAKAMMLMDQRVISTSAVRCVGNTLILQGRVYSPPFTITAIGDTGALRKALDRDPTVKNYRAYVDIAGLGYKVQELDGKFPAYGGSWNLRHAKPLGSQS